MEVMTADEIGLVNGGGLTSFTAISVAKDWLKDLFGPQLTDQFKPKVEVVDLTGTYEEFIDPENPPEIPPKQ